MHCPHRLQCPDSLYSALALTVGSTHLKAHRKKPITMQKTTEQIVHLTAAEIWEKQGINTLALDLRGISTITDYCVVSEGRVDRHLKSLADAITARLMREGLRPIHIEGLATGDWTVLDYADFIVHLILPDLRCHYCLEEIWREGELLELDLPCHLDEEGDLPEVQNE